MNFLSTIVIATALWLGSTTHAIPTNLAALPAALPATDALASANARTVLSRGTSGDRLPKRIADTSTNGNIHVTIQFSPNQIGWKWAAVVHRTNTLLPQSWCDIYIEQVKAALGDSSEVVCNCEKTDYEDDYSTWLGDKSTHVHEKGLGFIYASFSFITDDVRDENFFRAIATRVDQSWTDSSGEDAKVD